LPIHHVQLNMLTITEKIVQEIKITT